MDKNLLFDFKADLGGDQGVFADDPQGTKGSLWGAELHPLSTNLVLMTVPGTFRQRGPGIYLIDIFKKTATIEPWFRPEIYKPRSKFIGTTYGENLCSLSSNRKNKESTAAVASGYGYASYWKVGTLEGGYLETSGDAHATAVNPGGDTLVIGTGGFVLDNASVAEAAVELWDLPSCLGEDSSLVLRRRLPGSVVAKLLWVQKKDGLLQSSIYNPLKQHSLQEVILAVSISRDQRTGYATMLDPIYLEILEICDFRLPSLQASIQAWPEEGEPFFRVDGYGVKYFSSFYENVCPDSSLDTLAAPLRTPLPSLLSTRLSASLEISISSELENGLSVIEVRHVSF